MAKGKKKGSTRRRRRSAPAKVARRRSRRGGGGGFMKGGWFPLALALFAGDVAGSTLLANLPAVVSPEAVVLYAAGSFLNRPALKDLALPVQAAHLMKMYGKEQAVKMLAGFKLGSFGGSKVASNGTGLPSVSDAAGFLRDAEVGGQQLAGIVNSAETIGAAFA